MSGGRPALAAALVALALAALPAAAAAAAPGPPAVSAARAGPAAEAAPPATPPPAAAGFAGTWRLDLDASELWPRGARRDTTRLDVLTLEAGVLHWRWTSRLAAPRDTGRVLVALDGGERANRVRGRATRNRARWDGDTLEVATRGRSLGVPFSIEDRLWLEDGGATLVMLRRARYALGNALERWVFRRAV